MAKYLEPKVNYDLYDKHVIRTVEAHTEGEYCRVALDCPELPGNTMIEKKHYLEEHYDYLRTMLMFEPRGHHDMFGAFLVEPVNPEADFGIFFMDGGGYLNMCGQSFRSTTGRQYFLRRRRTKAGAACYPYPCREYAARCVDSSCPCRGDNRSARSRSL